MLVEFTVGNYKSFKDRVTLSMVASNVMAKDKQLDENNVFGVGDELRLLTNAAIYGANASGKSNLIAAMRFMRRFVLGSSKDTQAAEAISVEPFRLSTETSRQPSFFEIVFILSGKRYRYGFEVNVERVISEWLY
ncbi:MAG: AAA family ATPase, partial [Chloroflexi bacterium]|nr:AAA family ATPase [Chloroflexota bacterium]